MAQVTPLDYAIVRATMNPLPNPRVAQEFLDAIDLGEAREFIKGVKYDPVYQKGLMCINTRVNVYRDHVTNSYPEERTTLKNDKTVYIGPTAFEDLGLPLFLSSLTRHERTHLEQIEKRFEVTRKIFHRLMFNSYDNLNWQAILEIPAYASQLADLSITEKKEIGIVMAWNLKQEKLFNLPRNLDKRKKLLDAILLGSEGDNIVRERYGL